MSCASSSDRKKDIARNSYPNSNKKICSEEEYVDILNKVIVDSYFPDLPKLRRKLAALEERGQLPEASENVDFLSSSYKINWLSRAQDSFSTLCTPQSFASHGTTTLQSEGVSTNYSRPLESFFRNYTSEDNYSFELLVKQEEEQKRKRNLLLSEDCVPDNTLSLREKAILKDSKQLVAIGQTGELTALGDTRPKRLHFWPFRERNSLFFCPSEAPLTEQELQLRKFVEERKEIKRDNTRFKSLPFLLAESFRVKTGDTESQSSSVDLKEEEIRILKRLGQRHRLLSTADENCKYERIDEDFFNHHLDTAEELNAFVPTSPILSPRNIPNSPFITWGQIAATPQLVEDDDEEGIQDELLAASHNKKQPQSDNSHSNFHIPNMDSRERAALHLEKKLTGKKRKMQDKRHIQTPASVSTSFSRNVALSPAAKRLADSLRIPSMHSVRRTPFTSYRRNE
ncbi:es2 protein [Galdieria sulphuraria]|uniref:Es2 protein n=1 Tax=Galdieria sulphuraria TaxID=130081 RepID=M2XIK2_GALSU|nr:es2 protein [Galdieria sulphuraria]EME29917.1 es2 protein [Galdieria sulphuraria]|eukprot:XP_005706437.1 es2 protein [Galdieria sulphuraria]